MHVLWKMYLRCCIMSMCMLFTERMIIEYLILIINLKKITYSYRIIINHKDIMIQANMYLKKNIIIFLVFINYL